MKKYDENVGEGCSTVLWSSSVTDPLPSDISGYTVTSIGLN
jgi:hypothetical protein